MNKKLIFLVMLVCLLAFVAVWAFAQNSPSVRWEYRVVTNQQLPFNNIETYTQRINALGADGWEFIGYENGVNVFKRRLP